jgi:hypothetical protein
LLAKESDRPRKDKNICDFGKQCEKYHLEGGRGESSARRFQGYINEAPYDEFGLPRPEIPKELKNG